MSSRLLVLGLLSLGAAGQMACSTDAEAGQASATSHADVLAQGGPPRDGRFCGGFAAVQCPEGLICADDTSDDCDPNAGGRDCGGICVVPNDDAKPKCDYSDPRMNYLSREPDKCPAISFQCPEGATAFFNDCGCGCEPSADACNYQNPNWRYVSQSPDRCAAIRFTCDAEEEPFFNACGCGCEKAPIP